MKKGNEKRRRVEEREMNASKTREGVGDTQTHTDIHTCRKPNEDSRTPQPKQTE